jgi:hypothetical protein
MKTIVISNRKGGLAKRSFFRKQAVAVCEADVSPCLAYQKGSAYQ